MNEHPVSAGTLGDIPRKNAALRGDAPALVFENRTTTYRQLDEATHVVAQALLAEDLHPGSRVAILAKDSDRTFELVLGCAKAGAVSLGINWRLVDREIGFILDDSGAEILFIGSEFLDKIGTCSGNRRIVVLDADDHDDHPAYGSWLDGHEAVDPAIEVTPDDIAVQMYTSGTTGLPKGVQLAHRSFFAVVDSLRTAGDEWIGWRPGDVSLLNIPAFHIGGLWWAMTGLAAGATNVVMDAFAGWKLLELIERHRVTKVCMVPAMIQMALSEPNANEVDLSSLEHIVYGGAPIPRSLLERALDVFGCRFAQIYGLTETGNTAVCLRPEDHDDLESPRLKAAGKPYPGVSIRCIDGEGNALAPGEVGEICIHSPANMVGYWNRPDATAETLVDGWIHTGDAGFLDEDGYVYVHDRVKDMIIYAGENIYPAEVESVLCGHPGVSEAAVIGIPDDRWGELVKAIVVRHTCEGTPPVRTRELLAHARGQLADFKVPQSVDFVEALPRTPSGKIQKAVLRAPYWEGRERQVN